MCALIVTSRSMEVINNNTNDNASEQESCFHSKRIWAHRNLGSALGTLVPLNQNTAIPTYAANYWNTIILGRRRKVLRLPGREACTGAWHKYTIDYFGETCFCCGSSRANSNLAAHMNNLRVCIRIIRTSVYRMCESERLHQVSSQPVLSHERRGPPAPAERTQSPIWTRSTAAEHKKWDWRNLIFGLLNNVDGAPRAPLFLFELAPNQGSSRDYGDAVEWWIKFLA